METPTIIIPCRGDACRKRLRIPATRGHLIVTCPDCQTSWEWVPPDPPTGRKSQAATHSRGWIVILLVALTLACGIWNGAWIPTSLFLVTSLVWWVCRRKAAASKKGLGWHKWASTLWEATASIAGAAAVGFASVIGLVLFLNLYGGLTPSHYPQWLPALQDMLVRISAWFNDESNKTLVAISYITVLLICVIVTALARRHNKEWRPVGELSKWKQRLTKAVVALQAFTFFTFFGQGSLNDYLLKLEQQMRWRYGVAQRAESRLTAKRLLAEQLKDAAEDNAAHSQEDRDDVIAWLAKHRPILQPSIPTSPSVERASDLPPGKPESPPPAPFGWRPPNWPQPPAPVLAKIKRGELITPDDYELSSSAGESVSSVISPSSEGTPGHKIQPRVADPRKAQAEEIVSVQLESAKPRSGGEEFAAGVYLDPATEMNRSTRTVEAWKSAKKQVAEQEVRTDQAEYLYGEAVQGALEALCEYTGLQVTADPLVEAWLDLTLNNLADRVYGYFFNSEPARLSIVAAHLRRLLSPRETAAEKIVAEIQARLQASDYSQAEQLIGDLLSKYAKTKAGRSASDLAEECSFRRAEYSFNAKDVSWEATIEVCSGYLRAHSRSPRSGSVRQWLAEAKQQKALAEIDARTPRMFIYVRDECSNSQYFREHTMNDNNVRAAMGRFRHEVRNVDKVSSDEQLKLLNTGEETLPIIVFENKAGEVLGTIGGGNALRSDLLLAKMRAVR
jgi:hypothetical protein